MAPKPKKNQRILNKFIQTAKSYLFLSFLAFTLN